MLIFAPSSGVTRYSRVFSADNVKHPWSNALTKDMLDDVVAVLILNQLVSVLVELFQNRCSLLRSAVFQDALDHAAAVGVGRQGEHLEN